MPRKRRPIVETHEKTDMMSRSERRKQARMEKKKQWEQDLRDRGGFIPKKAKKWGQPCSHKECEMCGDGECQYEYREKKGCYLEMNK